MRRAQTLAWQRIVPRYRAILNAAAADGRRAERGRLRALALTVRARHDLAATCRRWPRWRRRCVLPPCADGSLRGSGEPAPHPRGCAAADG